MSSAQGGAEPKATSEQLNMLVCHMYNNRQLALSQTDGHEDEWDELAARLNNTGRCSKTTEQWIQIWRREVIDSIRASTLWKHFQTSGNRARVPEPSARSKLICLMFESIILETNDKENQNSNLVQF